MNNLCQVQATIVIIFVDGRRPICTFDIANTIMDILYEKRLFLCKIVGNWMCTCQSAVSFPYLLKPVPKTGNAANL